MKSGLSGRVALADPALAPHAQSDLDFFTPLERIALGDLCDTIFQDATQLGVVQYIETLLTAFDSDPPKIYAGGPYSGRGQDPSSTDTSLNRFQDFIPLNRYQEAAWRLYLYGDSGVSGGTPNARLVGAKRGLRDIISQGVQQTALKIPESGLVVKPVSPFVLFSFLDPECKEAIRNLTVEACFSAPEYGGNLNQAGWKLANYRGDVAPYGYSHYDEQSGTYLEDANEPVSGPDPSADPVPLSFGTRIMFNVISKFTGKVFY